MRSIATLSSLLGAAAVTLSFSLPSSSQSEPLNAMTDAVIGSASVFACPYEKCGTETGACEASTKAEACIWTYVDEVGTCANVECALPKPVPKPRPVQGGVAH